MRAGCKVGVLQAALLAVVVVCAGCGVMRQQAINISESEWKNAECVQDVAEVYLLIWPIQSGLIRGALGPNLDRLPVESISAMAELDELAKRPSSAMTEYDWGYSLGLRIRIMSTIVMEALRVYAPDVFDAVIGMAMR